MTVLVVAVSACSKRQPATPASSAPSAPAPAAPAPSTAAPPTAAAAPAAPVPGASTVATTGTPVPPAHLAPQSQLAGALSVTSSNPVLYRWSDGDWVFRVSYSLRNTGNAPIDFDRRNLRVHEWTVWSADSTLAEHITVNPGLTLTGDVAWFTTGSAAEPTSLRVAYAPGDDDEAPVVFQREFQPVFVPAPPAAGTAPTRLVRALPIQVARPGLTFVHTDGDRAVRLGITVTNTTSVALRIPLDYFQGKLAGQAGSRWNAVTTFADPLEIPPGGSATGTVGWYWSGHEGAEPTAVSFEFGPLNAPAFNGEIPVSAGPSPVQ